MASGPIGAAQLLIIASGFGSLADEARSILSDDSITLTTNQSNLISSDMTSLYNNASNVATLAAKVAFEDADAAFQAISTSTKFGCDSLKALQTQVANVNKMCTILAASVSLGVAFGTGNPVAIVKGAVALKNAAA